MTSDIVVVHLFEVSEELLVIVRFVVGLEFKLGLLKHGFVRFVQVIEPLLLADLLEPVEVVYFLLKLVSPHFFNAFLSVIFRNDAFVGNNGR